VKYSPGAALINVTARSIDNSHVICIEDQGIGISKQDLPRIFERFFRAAPSGETQSGGLGLSIAQAIVQAHQGAIDCESTVGLGSVFTIRLPQRT